METMVPKYAYTAPSHGKLAGTLQTVLMWSQAPLPHLLLNLLALLTGQREPTLPETTRLCSGSRTHLTQNYHIMYNHAKGPNARVRFVKDKVTVMLDASQQVSWHQAKKI